MGAFVAEELAGRVADVHQPLQGADEAGGGQTFEPAVFWPVHPGNAGFAREREAGPPTPVLLRRENARDPGGCPGLGASIY